MTDDTAYLATARRSENHASFRRDLPDMYRRVNRYVPSLRELQIMESILDKEAERA